jgi:hypothetical protein
VVKTLQHLHRQSRCENKILPDSSAETTKRLAWFSLSPPNGERAGVRGSIDEYKGRRLLRRLHHDPDTVAAEVTRL